MRVFETTRRVTISVALLLALVACAPPYAITALTSQHFTAKQHAADVTFAAPSRPFRIIADFRGSEPGKCAEDLPYCELRQEASRMGADAVWIQQRSVFSYQDEWIMIQGRLTKIEHPTITTVSGVFVRYDD